jgi:protease II
MCPSARQTYSIVKQSQLIKNEVIMIQHLVIAPIFLLLVFGCQTATIQKGQSTGFVYDGHGVESVPAELLNKYAPGELPRELVVKLEAMLDLRSPSTGELTEDGQTLIFNWNVTGISHIWRRDQKGGFPVQLTGGVESARLVGLCAKGKSFFFHRDRAGDEFFGIYEMDLAGGEAREIFSQPRVSAGLQIIEPSGRYLYYYANNLSSSSYALYRFDRKTKEHQLLVSEPGFWRFADRLDSGTLMLARMKTNTTREYYLLDEATLALTPLLGQDEEEDYQVSFTNQTDEYLVRTNKFGEFHRLYYYNAQTKTFRSLTEELNFDIQFTRLSPDRTRVLTGVNENGYLRPRAYRLPEFTSIQLPMLEGASLENVFWGASTFNSRYTTIGADHYNRPLETMVIDWQTMRLSRLSEASTPEISTEGFTRAILETYTTRDGTQIPMLVNRPAHCHDRVCPVVVSFHGGPESQQWAGFSPRVQAFVEEGFIFVRPNVRGSRGFGKTWLAADDGPKRLEVITDIADVALYIQKNWARDGVTPRVGVMGGSYGGYSTFMAMTKFAGIYQAGVASVGMSSLVTFLQNTADYRRALRESEYGSLEHDREALIALSPVTYLDRLRDPLLIIHGATDPRVPAGEAIMIMEQMEKRKISGELILFADEGHGIRRRPNQVMGLGHTLRFFNEHLKQ